MMIIENHMSSERFSLYAASQERMIADAVDALEEDWEHAPYIRSLLEETGTELQVLVSSERRDRGLSPAEAHERKIEKYLTWIEVMRLAAFQYGRYSSQRRSMTEGLYSTLLALSSQYCHDLAGMTIAVPGCGPGRTVLDFARAYPEAMVAGMDYSLLSLVAARRILGPEGGGLKVPVRDTAGDRYSELITVPHFPLANCRLCLCDLTEGQTLRADLIICSNTVNLLPDHDRTIGILADMLRPDGVIVFADLTGWRLDRHPKQTVLRNDRAISECFAYHHIRCLEMFRGGPYIEQETPENYTIYHEHFYVGKKDGIR